MKKWAVLLALMLAGPAYAIEGTNCGGLSSICNIADRWGDGFCIGYSAGAWHSSAPFIKACIPGEVSNGQVAAIVKKWLADHPEALHLAAATCVTRALQDAYPCPSK